MKNLKSVVLLACLIHCGVGLDIALVKALASPLGKLLSISWNELNPYSLDNQIKTVSRDVKEIKGHLQKIEIAVIFGQDLKTIEYLIESYVEVINKNDDAKQQWADTALEFGRDGFKKCLTSLKEMMDGTSNLFAEESIFEVIANR